MGKQQKRWFEQGQICRLYTMESSQSINEQTLPLGVIMVLFGWMSMYEHHTVDTVDAGKHQNAYLIRRKQRQ